MENKIINKVQHKDAKDDKKICIALMASFVILTFQYFVLIFFDLIGSSSGAMIQLTSKALVGVTFMYALPAVLKRNLIKFIGTYFIAAFILMIHYGIFPENRVFMKALLFPLFFMSLPAFTYSMSIYDWSIFKDIMKKASFIVFIFGTILGILIFAGRASVGSYSMSLSYYMLLPTIMLIDQLFDKFSFKILLGIIISLLVILALGSRGAVLCAVVFVFLKLIRFVKKLNYKSVLSYFSLFGIVIIGYIYLDSILESLYSFLLRYEIRSRSISLFLGDKVYLSGRDKLYELVIDAIAKNPLIGIGIAGDRYLIGGGYVHNLFIEIICNFGIIIGSILSIVIIIIMLKSLVSKNLIKYNMIIIWISLGFVSLMVSGSYLESMNFWILMGLMVNSNRISKLNWRKN